MTVTAPVGGVWAMKDGDFQPSNFASTTAGIQAAIDYLAGGRGEVYLAPGTYSITSALTLASNLCLRGAGQGRTVLQHSGTTLHTMLAGTSKSFWSLRDLTIDGNMSAVSSYSANRWDREETIDLATCSDFSIDDVELTACKGQGIYGTGCTRVSIRRCYIHDTDNWGSVFKATSDLDYIDNHVETVYTHGLYCDAGGASADATRIRFIGNTAISCQHDTTYAASGIGMSVQVGSTYSVVDTICQGNYAKSNGSMGFSMTPGDNASGFLGKMIVSGNTSEGHTAQSGIGFECIGVNVVFSNNIAKNNKYHFTSQDSKDLSYLGNQTISAAGSTQIAFFIGPAAVGDPVLDYTMVGNRCFGGTGLQVSSTAASHTNLLIRDNQFIDCEYGALIQNSSINRIDFSGNMIDGTNATLGKGFQGYASHVSLIGNTIAAKSTADAVVIVSGFTTPMLVMRDNSILAGNYAFNVAGAVTTCYASGNLVGTMTTGTWSTKNNITNFLDGGGNSWSFVTAAPTTEYWHKGQRVWNTSPASRGNAGWECIAAGTPGTWQEFAHGMADTDSPTFGTLTVATAYAEPITFTGSGANRITATHATGVVRLNAAGGVQQLEANGTGIDVANRLTVAGGLRVGSSGAIATKVLTATASLNFDLSAVIVHDLTITVTGAAVGDCVWLGTPNGSVTTTVQYSAWVSAADTVTVRAVTDAVGENPASGTFRVAVIQF